MPDDNAKHRLVAVTLDEDSIGRGNPDQEHERAIAIFDILEENSLRFRGARGRSPSPWGWSRASSPSRSATNPAIR